MAKNDANMDIVDMARTPAERKAAQERMTAQMDSDGPEYPYGLCICLGKDELTKLGIDELPEIGDEFHLYAVARVTNVHLSMGETGDDSRGVSLQITDMGTMHEDEVHDGTSPGEKFSAAAQKLYGKAEKAEGE